MKKMIILLLILVGLLIIPAAYAIPAEVGFGFLAHNNTLGAPVNATHNTTINIYALSGGAQSGVPLANRSDVINYFQGVSSLHLLNLGGDWPDSYCYTFRLGDGTESACANITPSLQAIYAFNATNAGVANTISGTITEDQVSDLQHSDNSTILTNLSQLRGNISELNGSSETDELQDLWETINSDAGSVAANTQTDTLTVAGGNDIDTSVSGDTLTVTLEAILNFVTHILGITLITGTEANFTETNTTLLRADNINSTTINATEYFGDASGLTGITGDNASWNESHALDLFVDRTDWTTHDNYPAACSAGEAVQAVGDTLTCIAVSTGGSGIEWISANSFAKVNETAIPSFINVSGVTTEQQSNLTKAGLNTSQICIGLSCQSVIWNASSETDEIQDLSPFLINDSDAILGTVNVTDRVITSNITFENDTSFSFALGANALRSDFAFSTERLRFMGPTNSVKFLLFDTPSSNVAFQFAHNEGVENILIDVPIAGPDLAVNVRRSLTVGCDNVNATACTTSSFLDFSADSSGADVWVQDDLEVNGTIYVRDWTNFTGTESQITDLVHTTDTNESGRVRNITGFAGCSVGDFVNDFDVFGNPTCDTAAGGGGAGDKWNDNGTFISPNGTFADSVFVPGNFNVSNQLFVVDSIAQNVMINHNVPLDIFNVNGTVDILHTATGTDQHALEIDTFAGGFGDVNSMHIFYSTGVLSAGNDEAIILIDLDESASTGGDVVALEVLSTEGSAIVYALEAGVNVAPIIQLSGTFVDMGNASVQGVDALGNFTSITNDIVIFENDNDFVSIGDASKFEEIEFLFNTTAGGSGIAPTFEFSTGIDTWGTFTPTDGTNGMRQNGVIAWFDEDIPTWATGVDTLFHIRINRTRNSIPTIPIESKVQIASALVFKWDKDGKLFVSEINGSIVRSDNWTNITITESQVSDLAHTVDTFNTTEQIQDSVGDNFNALNGNGSIAYNDASNRWDFSFFMSTFNFLDLLALPDQTRGGNASNASLAHDVFCADCVTLTTETSGNYVATVTGGTAITSSVETGEGAATTISVTADSIGDTQLAFDTGQALTTTSDPTFRNLTISNMTHAGSTSKYTWNGTCVQIIGPTSTLSIC